MVIPVLALVAFASVLFLDVVDPDSDPQGKDQLLDDDRTIMGADTWSNFTFLRVIPRGALYTIQLFITKWAVEFSIRMQLPVGDVFPFIVKFSIM